MRFDCVRRRNSSTPASFALIQRLNQLLNQQTQFLGVCFICHRKAKFTPILLCPVSHSHLDIRCEMLTNAVTRLQHVDCHGTKWFYCLGSQHLGCSFHHSSGNFGVQDSLYYPVAKQTRLGDTAARQSFLAVTRHQNARLGTRSGGSVYGRSTQRRKLKANQRSHSLTLHE